MAHFAGAKAGRTGSHRGKIGRCQLWSARAKMTPTGLVTDLPDGAQTSPAKAAPGSMTTSTCSTARATRAASTA
jgi:hypothetical protein